MKWYSPAAGILTVMIILMVLFTGCSDQPEGTGDDVLPLPPNEPRYTAGDIVSKIGGQEEPLWLILGYDNATEEYERAFIYKKTDGTWGYRKDARSDSYPRAEMEKLYPVKIAHVKVSLVRITSEPSSSTETTPFSTDSAPEITGITPDSGPSGTRVSITDLSGKHFTSGVTVMLAGAGSPSIIATDVRNTGSKITCTFDLFNATTGKRDVIVTNPDGRTDVLANGFTITSPAPAIGLIDPYEAVAGETTMITITGANFESPAMVFFVKNGVELEGGNVQVKNSNLITVALAVPSDTEAGIWGVIIRNVADDQNSTTLRKFTIKNAT